MTDPQPLTDNIDEGEWWDAHRPWTLTARLWRVARAERAENARLREVIRGVRATGVTEQTYQALRDAVDGTTEADQESLEGMIRRRLADSTPLSPESARAIEDMLRQTYERLNPPPWADGTSEADQESSTLEGAE